MNEESQTWADWLLGVPLRIAAIIAGAVLLTLLLRWLIGRVVKRLSSLSGSTHIEHAQIAIGGQPNRLGQRLRTFQSVINSTLTSIIGVVALLMILSELGLDVRPLIASAGIVGVALAFGAQSLVRDIVSGLFMLAEDQYGVGDRVELAAGFSFAVGTVERVALRVTTVRDDDGKLWHVRNGEILRVANESQGWALASAEIRLAPASDLTLARQVLEETTAALAASEPWSAALLSDPSILVEDISASSAVIRWSVRTHPGSQWSVASAFRHRIPGALAEAGLSLAE